MKNSLRPIIWDTWQHLQWTTRKRMLALIEEKAKATFRGAKIYFIQERPRPKLSPIKFLSDLPLTIEIETKHLFLNCKTSIFESPLSYWSYQSSLWWYPWDFQGVQKSHTHWHNPQLEAHIDLEIITLFTDEIVAFPKLEYIFSKAFK